jgi:hypothetical protein
LTFGVYQDPQGQSLIEQYDFMVEYNNDALSLSVLGFVPGNSHTTQNIFNKSKEAITQGLFLSTFFAYSFSRSEKGCPIIAAAYRESCCIA